MATTVPDQRHRRPDAGGSTEPVGIKAFGAFVPRLRLARSAIAAAHAWAVPSLKGNGTKAMCSWDEDAITLAVEAGRDCLGHNLGGAPYNGVAAISIVGLHA